MAETATTDTSTDAGSASRSLMFIMALVKAPRSVETTHWTSTDAQARSPFSSLIARVLDPVRAVSK